MRRLVIAILGFWLATSAVAYAENGFAPQGKHSFTPGGAGPYKSPSPRPAPSGFGASPFDATSPTSHAPRPTASFSTIAPLKPIGSMESFGGGAPFKPFKGTSVYDSDNAVKPYKPPKIKSVYDH